MAFSLIVPQAGSQWIDPTGKPTPVFYRFIVSLVALVQDIAVLTPVAGGSSTSATISDLQQKVADLSALVLTAESPHAAISAMRQSLADLAAEVLTQRAPDLAPIRQRVADLESLLETARPQNLGPLLQRLADLEALVLTARPAMSGAAGTIEPRDGYWSELTNGDGTNPELIYTLDGDTISVWTQTFP